jgi:1,3-beta-glucanosyltransferase GAS5
VNYQPGGSSELADPLANAAQCKLDAPFMKTLGVNVIRVYTVFPDKNHDACMQTFNDAGIYVLIDLPTPEASISRVRQFNLTGAVNTG